MSSRCKLSSNASKIDTSSNMTQKDEMTTLQLTTTAPKAPVKVATIPSLISSSQISEHESPRKIYDHSSNKNIEGVATAAEPIDFIGSSRAVRHLFSLPYSTDKNVSVALHTVGNGTILLESGDTVDDPVVIFGLNDGTEGEAASRRPGRRKRPQNWAVDSQRSSSEDNGGQSQISGPWQGEKSLLASLSMLLEEERQLDKSRNAATASDRSNNTMLKATKVNIIEDIPGAANSTATSNETIIARSKVENMAKVANMNNERRVSFVAPQSVVNSSDGIEANKPRNTDPNDILADKLHPPKHYLRHAVSPPTEPKQYMHWKFKDMNLLVASDAMIYKSPENGANDKDNSVDKDTKSIVIKVADASDLRAKMEYHQAMVKAGIAIPNSESKYRKALPPSSYAEALLKEKPDGEKEVTCDANNLDHIKLQTCIIPSFNVGLEWSEFGFSISPSPSNNDFNATTSAAQKPFVEMSEQTTSTTGSSSHTPYSSTPCCTVLDTYLDNIMANVPQLALILREHGFIQNIKLIQTEDIPSLLMHPSTLGDGSSYPDSAPEPIFSPEIVEMNAAMLLRFLKTNCTRENATYLLHRSVGDTNLQLFDISSISQLRQRKWIWWLALCSYRFACRLEQLQSNVLSPLDKATRRDYRKRQRSLLHNTLNLLEDLADMDGGRHETIGAAVYEHLADTYLWSDEADGDAGTRDPKKPAPIASSFQPYRRVTVDCLNKAHGHLTKAIALLGPLLAKAQEDNAPIELEAISMQLYGMHHKLVNVCLRLADNHLQNYFSSNLVHSLRMAARMLSDATSLLVSSNMFKVDRPDESNAFIKSILLQYSWLWEYCGHFARSFAADELWRERGHTCGNDLLSLFREVDSACFNIKKNCFGSDWKLTTVIGVNSHGQVSLKSLTGIVVLPNDFEQIERSVLQKEGCHEAIRAAKSIIYEQPQIKRDVSLVLVAATTCYSHAIDAYQRLARQRETDTQSNDCESTPPLLFQRLGDACNEIGQILLKTSRQVLVSGLPQEMTKISSSIENPHVSAIMLTSAQFWFLQGLEQFVACKDLRNIALLRCNLCQCCKIRANANVVLPGSANSIPNESEQYLQQAVDHLILAHDAMGHRETDPMTWDMVSEELAATLLVLGVRRRQSSLVGSSSSADPLTKKSFRPAPGVEKSIVEPMERSCKIYESLGTPRSEQQAAAAHYQLAIYFSKVWTCQRDESKTREKLASAFHHFGNAYHYYSYHSLGNEPTFVCLSLDFSNFYSAVSDREDCLVKALAICLDCRKAFTPESISSMRTKPNAKDWFSQMTTLSTNIQERVSKLLLSLVMIEKNRGDAGKYKHMYREVLSYKILTAKQNSSSNDLPESFGIHDILQMIADSLSLKYEDGI
ncbi:hypothetical protein ACHAW6_006072 [Cyclotella cf. meneghiniana]